MRGRFQSELLLTRFLPIPTHFIIINKCLRWDEDAVLGQPDDSFLFKESGGILTTSLAAGVTVAKSLLGRYAGFAAGSNNLIRSDEFGLHDHYRLCTDPVLRALNPK